MKQIATNSIKTEYTSNLPLDISSTSQMHVLPNSKINRFSISKHKKKLQHKNTIQNELDKDTPNILTSEELEKSTEEMTDDDNEANKLTYEDFRLTKENNSDENLINTLDSKDKRRHYLIKSKQFLHLGKNDFLWFYVYFFLRNNLLKSFNFLIRISTNNKCIS